ncbi:MAG: GNAT family N-acetyltransferase [Prochloraceae cyanobacterium]|nr:GNAT family N-acetyltransferase [Prochloraceae cyanobacterium]
MDKIDCKIRKANQNEAKILSNLAIHSKAYWGYDRNFMNACLAELIYSLDDIQNKHFFVAEIDSSIVGFYALDRLSNTEMELDALFVAPAYIGKGYGRILINHAKNKAIALGASKIVIQGDPNAKNFYISAGGIITGERESLSIPGRYLPIFIIELDT